jgi:uncharacterized protein
MIIAKIQKNTNGVYQGFSCTGHAGYAKAGQDIVCAAVSVLVINTANSICLLTEDKIEVMMSDENDIIAWKFLKTPEHYAVLLMDSMVLGLQEIERNYKHKYIKLIFEEV